MFTKLKFPIKPLVQWIKSIGTVGWLCIIMILVLVPFSILAFELKDQTTDQRVYVMYIDTQGKSLHRVDEKFLSLGLDSTVITDGYIDFNMKSKKLIAMIKHLSPAYLRIGGNQADQIVFSTEEDQNSSDIHTLTATDWVKFNALATESKINLIYDLNSLLRHENGSWDSENARQMLDFSQEHNFTVDWELGNEPNSYFSKFNISINATQLGLDYQNFRAILNDYLLYRNSSIIGPSTTRLRTEQIEKYLLDFLLVGYDSLNALSFHHYYFSGENATIEEFLDPSIFDYLEYCIDAVKSVTEFIPNFNIPIWLGETSTAWHSGAPNMSDKFLASFLWIDKLGLSAKMGIDLVIRQSIFKGNYALINNTYDPNPDWWLSVLYKQLVGPQVITTESEGDPNVRLYAHCANSNQLLNDESAVVIFGVNLSNQTSFVEIKELSSDSTISSYELTSKNLLSQYLFLNGKVLKLEDNYHLPNFVALPLKRTQTMTLSPLSIVFWVFTNTNINACGN